MLIRRRILQGIASGDITLAFRRWKRPTVRSGGTLRTALGVLAIEDLRVVNEGDIREEDASRAGFDSRADLIDELRKRRQGKLYRIELRFAGPDPRTELCEKGTMTAEEAAGVRQTLARSDAASKCGPWTEQTLKLIGDNPGCRAADLAAKAGFEKAWFKSRVRRLKGAGSYREPRDRIPPVPSRSCLLRGHERLRTARLSAEDLPLRVRRHRAVHP